jgi:predicted nucleic-acid-binding Zn-ribbon protein
MVNLYEGFYNAVKGSYFNYLLYGDRSVEKLKPLHFWIGNTIKRFLSNEYDLYFLNGKEVQTEGEYYTKIIDVGIVKKGIEVTVKRSGYRTVFYIPKIEMAISIKFITSNFKQNANNYFENLLGECANLRARGMKFGHFVVFRDKIPYFQRSKAIRNWEILEDEDIKKYIKLFQEREKYLHAPNFIGLEIVNISPIVEEYYNRKPKFTSQEIEKINAISSIKIQNGIDASNLSEDVKKLVINYFNLTQFFANLKNLLNS